MFCQKCGSVLLPKKEGNKKVLACSGCGFKAADAEKTKITENVKSHGKEVEVVDPSGMETLPKTDAECEKCGHKKAFFWTVQTRSGDEPETKFLKCEKCSHIWRDYD